MSVSVCVYSSPYLPQGAELKSEVYVQFEKQSVFSNAIEYVEMNTIFL